MIPLKMKTLWVAAVLGLAVLTGCCSSPRFTHVDTDAAPFVFFDQKTQQICWGSADPDLYMEGKPQIITVRPPNGDATQTKMPICKDLK